jgi:prepilin-type N-terminal cleavage/methylation domain-containing protein
MTRSGVGAALGMNAKFMFFLRSRAKMMTGAGAEKPRSANGTRGRMNLAEKARGLRAGFTLVEVIVVLVILAILAAIAIPALTGYIDKAQDKKWIAQARDIVVAVRTLLDESYASGDIAKDISDSQSYKDYYVKGQSTSMTDVKQFILSALAGGNFGSGNSNRYQKEASKLVGAQWPAGNDRALPGFWDLTFFALDDDSYTVLNAPAFMYTYYPEGWVANTVTPEKPVIRVYYGLNHKAGIYDLALGYSVLYMTTKDI